jgi:soluble lytic murein transglycosylase-like protein
MPKIREYEQQTAASSNGVGEIQSRRASASDFGADASQFAQELQNTGFSLAAIQRDAEEKKARRLAQAEMQQAQVAHSTVDADLAIRLQEAAKEATPGDVTFADTIVQEAAAALENAGKSFNTPEAQGYFKVSSAKTLADIRVRANHAQAKISSDGVVLAHETEVRNVTTKISADPSYFTSDVPALAASIRAGNGRYSFLDINQREKLAQQFENETAMVAGLTLAQRNPQGTLGSVSPNALKANTPISYGLSAIPKPLTQYADAINSNANRFGVPASLLAAQLMAESAGNAKAVNNADIRVTGEPSIGIAQFQPATAKQYGVDPTNPEQSIQGQANYMSDLLKKYGGDQRLALAAYNWGPGNLDNAIAKAKGGAVRLPSTTEKYVSKILASSGTEKAPSNVPQGSSANEPDWAKYLTPEQRRQVEHVSTVTLNQQRAVARSDIEQKVRDQASQAMTTGYAGDIIKQQDFINAYGPEEGAKKYNDEYLPLIKFGKDVASVAPMTITAQDRLLESSRPIIGQAHYAEQQARFEAISKAVDHSRKNRANDPIQFALQNKIPGVNQISLSSLDTAADGIVARQTGANAMSKSFGTQLALLTNAEAASISSALRDGKTSEKVNFIKKLSNSMSDRAAFRSVIAQTTRGSPEVLVAASLLGDKAAEKRIGVQQLEHTSGLILEGQALLNKAPIDGKSEGAFRAFPMPKEAELYSAFSKEVGSAFAGQPAAANAAYQAVKAYYAGSAARSGNLEGRDKTNTKLLREAMANVIGDVVDVNGKSSAIAPLGMDRSEFKDNLELNFDAVVPEYAGRFGVFGIRGLSGGSYVVMNGDAPLLNKNGKEVIITAKPQSRQQHTGKALLSRALEEDFLKSL